jgi:hypothetical protein
MYHEKRPFAPRATPEQVAQVLYIRQAERDQELTLIRIALKSGTSARYLG